MNNSRELINRFIKFEEDKNLFNLKIKGIYFWPHIRATIYNKIRSEKFNLGVERTKISNLKRISYYLKNLYDSIKKNPFYHIRQVDLLVFNHPRRVKLDNNNWISIYTDYFLNKIDMSYYVFERPYLGQHFKPIITQNIRYLDLIYRIASLSKLKRYLNYFSKKEKFLVETIQQNIENEFNIDFEDRFLLKLLSSKIPNVKNINKIYTFLIEKIDPKFIVEVAYCNSHHIVINEIASKKNIITIELQHGVIGKDHIAYNFFKKRNYKWFPDYIVLFGDFWKNNARFPVENDHLKIFGFPHHNRMVRNYSNIKYSGKIRILFISQGPIGHELSKLAYSLNKILDTDKYQIIYKLHPGEYGHWKNIYKELLNSSIKVIDNQKKNLYYYFSTSRYQVGVCSTALYEGLSFNLITFIYKTKLSTYMSDLYNNNIAYLIEDENEILKLLEKDKKLHFNKYNFWSETYNKNFENLIKNL